MLINWEIDREEMSRDTDFQLNENDDDDEEVETWDGEGEWTAEGEEVENDAKDESSAYLDFLNDQVRPYPSSSPRHSNDFPRLKSSAINTRMMMMMTWKRRACSKHHWTKWNRMVYSRTHFFNCNSLNLSSTRICPVTSRLQTIR